MSAPFDQDAPEDAASIDTEGMGPGPLAPEGTDLEPDDSEGGAHD